MSTRVKDPRFLWLVLLLNLGFSVHLHVKRAAVTTCFTEIMYWKGMSSCPDPVLSTIEKTGLGRGCRETWKRNKWSSYSSVVS